MRGIKEIAVAELMFRTQSNSWAITPVHVVRRMGGFLYYRVVGNPYLNLSKANSPRYKFHATEALAKMAIRDRLNVAIDRAESVTCALLNLRQSL